ncbi:hypothetical protein SLS58_007193 [Diplodia intermedia]|uniref:Uncharacterized protein n=1 Tax=Diplodia intermedia TaxID=856260 RepID=A0ABR3TLI8_9PEZI
MESQRCEATIGAGGRCSFRATNPTLRLCGTHVRQQRDNPEAFRRAPMPSPSSSPTPSAAAPEPPSVPRSPANPGENPSTAAAAVARQLARMAAAPDAPPPPPLAAHPAFRHDVGGDSMISLSAGHTPAPFAAETLHRRPAWMRPRPLPAVLPQRTPPRPAAYRPTGAPVAANAANAPPRYIGHWRPINRQTEEAAPPRYIGHWRPINRHSEEYTPSPTPCPVVPQRCDKVHRNSGRRCRNMTEIANGYCFAHQPSDAGDGEESPVGGACGVMGCGGESFEPENEYCEEHQWMLRRLIGLNGS